MEELVKIEVRDGQQLVDGRDLHEFLEVGTRYDTWVGRIIENIILLKTKTLWWLFKKERAMKLRDIQNLLII